MKKSFFFLLYLLSFKTYSQNIVLQPIYFNETINNITIKDDYRFIENNKDTTIQNWYKANSIYTKNILNKIPGRKELYEQFSIFDKRKTSTVSIFHYGNNQTIYFLKTDEKDNTIKAYIKNRQEEKVLFDPKEYKKETGLEYSITYAKVSWDEKFIALNLVKKGEEIGEIIFLNIHTKTILPINLTNNWASIGGINWLKDNSGIIYMEIPVIDKNNPDYILNSQSVVYKLNDYYNSKKIVFSKKNNSECTISSADFPYFLSYSPKDKYVIATLGGVSSYRDTYYFSYSDLEKNKINYKLLYKKEDGFFGVYIYENYIYALSSKNNPNFSIVRTSIDNPNFENPEIIVKENKYEVIDDYALTPEGLFYTTTKNGIQAKLYLAKNGNVKELILPKNAGKITLSTKTKYENEIWVTISGWLNSNERYLYSPKTNTFIEDNITPVPQYPEFANLIIEEIEIPAEDGKLIPVSIIRNKNIKYNGKNNVILNSYGAYGVSIKPSFQTIYLTWVLKGGIYVVSHVRGGGEKGSKWYKDGFKETKPNSWKDLIATAEYLIKKKITSNKKIAIIGLSAGGITVGRAITERPDLFKVLIGNSADFNISRIKNTPNGPNNMKEFGNPDIEKEFINLLEMDAYLKIKKGVKYPACFIDVGMNDARVPIWNSGKFVSKLKNCTSSKNPILFSIRYDSGHYSPKNELNDKFADYFAFTLWQLGHPDFQVKK
ncbi:Prolyl endopeptidase precursor [Flavobacterium columnare]|uniref:Prolyl oligopeptidase family serine peptidase n=2 Tax=Flavobacterium TaxID=237 RepID=A0ABW8PP01_9FLAO|nr:prolyl oligopeptidase family serine peptidase [Flavobacterium columnare]SPE78332.1 Prolyl endopeptidase precursor [Flavobacterium columnare]